MGLIYAGLTALAQAAPSVTLAWDPTPDASVVGYALYYGGASRQYTNSVNTGLATSNTVVGLQVGVTYYFAATARATNGLESDFSNEVSYRPNSGTNTAPLPNTGPDQTITLPNPATLAGTASDDGLPSCPARSR